MTSFLRTRKDRHPKPDNKNRLPHEHDQSPASAHSGAVTQERLHQAYDEHREELGKDGRNGETTHKSQNGNTYGKAH